MTGPAPTLLAALALATGLLALPARATCETAPPQAAAPHDADAPRQALLALVQRATQRSQAVGAAALLAEAARQDAEETRAGALPQLSLNAQIGQAGSQPEGGPMNSGGQLRPTISLSAPLWDAGRQHQLEAWRAQQAEAAHQGLLSATEQVALQTVQLALERSRLQAQAQVHAQYAQAVCALVDSLEQIVATDRGRGSELVQARKTLAQVELARSQVRSQQRLAEQRLRRFVGPELPAPAALAGLLPELPALAPLQAAAGRNADIAQLAAQREAAQRWADATLAGQRPQAGWVVSAARNLVGDHTATWQAGISLTVPLHNPAAAPQLAAARQRAEAARLQHDEALEALRSRIAEAHAQAEAALQRAGEVAGVAADSQRVRDDTLLMWRQLGRRSLFDLISAEADHVGLRLAQVDAQHDGQQALALLWSLAGGVLQPLAP